MFHFIFSVVQEQHIVVPSPECPLAAVDGNVYSLVHVSQYELTFKNMFNSIYFDIQVSSGYNHRTSQTMKKLIVQKIRS